MESVNARSRSPHSRLHHQERLGPAAGDVDGNITAGPSSSHRPADSPLARSPSQHQPRCEAQSPSQSHSQFLSLSPSLSGSLPPSASADARATSQCECASEEGDLPDTVDALGRDNEGTNSGACLLNANVNPSSSESSLSGSDSHSTACTRTSNAAPIYSYPDSISACLRTSAPSTPSGYSPQSALIDAHTNTDTGVTTGTRRKGGRDRDSDIFRWNASDSDSVSEPALRSPALAPAEESCNEKQAENVDRWGTIITTVTGTGTACASEMVPAHGCTTRTTTATTGTASHTHTCAQRSLAVSSSASPSTAASSSTSVSASGAMLAPSPIIYTSTSEASATPPNSASEFEFEFDSESVTSIGNMDGGVTSNFSMSVSEPLTPEAPNAPHAPSMDDNASKDDLETHAGAETGDRVVEFPPSTDAYLSTPTSTSKSASTSKSKSSTASSTTPTRPGADTASFTYSGSGTSTPAPLDTPAFRTPLGVYPYSGVTNGRDRDREGYFASSSSSPSWSSSVAVPSSSAELASQPAQSCVHVEVEVDVEVNADKQKQKRPQLRHFPALTSTSTSTITTTHNRTSAPEGTPSTSSPTTAAATQETANLNASSPLLSLPSELIAHILRLGYFSAPQPHVDAPKPPVAAPARSASGASSTTPATSPTPAPLQGGWYVAAPALGPHPAMAASGMSEKAKGKAPASMFSEYSSSSSSSSSYQSSSESSWAHMSRSEREPDEDDSQSFTVDERGFVHSAGYGFGRDAEHSSSSSSSFQDEEEEDEEGSSARDASEALDIELDTPPTTITHDPALRLALLHTCRALRAAVFGDPALWSVVRLGPSRTGEGGVHRALTASPFVGAACPSPCAGSSSPSAPSRPSRQSKPYRPSYLAHQLTLARAYPLRISLTAFWERGSSNFSAEEWDGYVDASESVFNLLAGTLAPPSSSSSSSSSLSSSSSSSLSSSSSSSSSSPSSSSSSSSPAPLSSLSPASSKDDNNSRRITSIMDDERTLRWEALELVSPHEEDWALLARLTAGRTFPNLKYLSLTFVGRSSGRPIPMPITPALSTRGQAPSRARRSSDRQPRERRARDDRPGARHSVGLPAGAFGGWRPGALPVLRGLLLRGVDLEGVVDDVLDNEYEPMCHSPDDDVVDPYSYSHAHCPDDKPEPALPSLRSLDMRGHGLWPEAKALNAFFARHACGMRRLGLHVTSGDAVREVFGNVPLEAGTTSSLSDAPLRIPSLSVLEVETNEGLSRDTAQLVRLLAGASISQQDDSSTMKTILVKESSKNAEELLRWSLSSRPPSRHSLAGFRGREARLAITNSAISSALNALPVPLLSPVGDLVLDIPAEDDGWGEAPRLRKMFRVFGSAQAVGGGEERAGASLGSLRRLEVRNADVLGIVREVLAPSARGSSSDYGDEGEEAEAEEEEYEAQLLFLEDDEDEHDFADDDDDYVRGRYYNDHSRRYIARRGKDEKEENRWTRQSICTTQELVVSYSKVPGGWETGENARSGKASVAFVSLFDSARSPSSSSSCTVGCTPSPPPPPSTLKMLTLNGPTRAQVAAVLRSYDRGGGKHVASSRPHIRVEDVRW